MLHTLTLTTPKRVLGESGFLKLTTQLISNNLVEIDYFGIEPDNQADYIDAEMQDKIDNNTIINIYFEGDQIDYNSFSAEEILNLASKILKEPKEGTRVVADQKDIDIYV
ncbi:hypothetical protein [Flavobacterium sp. GSB-24]|uniref:hypothetical protein n=1 Tax=Flavobacterium sp. GSB-24 TaxID=2994319 RepID=UPI0024933D10|nr:hypothetical protein [Flavobacterium sp. GSB-24]BDU27709.1 hypothetical protein FLGSB24_44530 [Flavobacterium sp. GSB-24]